MAADSETQLAHCKRTLICSEDLRDPFLIPELEACARAGRGWDRRRAEDLAEIDNRNRVLRGLCQRLVNAEGLDALAEAAEYFCTHPIEAWPLPVLDDSQAQRILDLVTPIQPPNDYLLALWRNDDGSPGFDYTDRKP